MFLTKARIWDLERKLADFAAYYNSARVHTGLDGHTPSGFASGHPGARAELNKVHWISHCRGLVQLPMQRDEEFETAVTDSSLGSVTIGPTTPDRGSVTLRRQWRATRPPS